MSEQLAQQRKPFARPRLRVVEPEAANLDEQKLEDMYAAHADAVFRYILGRTFGDVHLAEDLLQETFLRAWRTPELRSGAPETCHAWLVTVARNLVIDRLRRRGRRLEETGADELPQLASSRCDIDRVVTMLTLQKAMAKLTPRRREVLVRTYFQERSLTEVAAALDIPVGTVKSRLYEALRALRIELAEPIAVSRALNLATAA
jgi:RNA polymerase sigma-70 factor, ECF subfamily